MEESAAGVGLFSGIDAGLSGKKRNEP